MCSCDTALTSSAETPPPLSLQSPRDTLERTFDSGIAKLKDLPAKAIETA